MRNRIDFLSVPYYPISWNSPALWFFVFTPVFSHSSFSPVISRYSLFVWKVELIPLWYLHHIIVIFWAHGVSAFSRLPRWIFVISGVPAFFDFFPAFRITANVVPCVNVVGVQHGCFVLASDNMRPFFAECPRRLLWSLCFIKNVIYEKDLLAFRLSPVVPIVLK